MAANEALLRDLDREVVGTRKTLERVPDGKADWKPHEKSTPLGRLAGHLAELPKTVLMVLSNDVFDVAKRGGSGMKPQIAESTAENVKAFDENVAAARAALESATEEQLEATWKLQAGEKVLLAQPRADAIRTMCFYHSAHHRAQLGVYLRLLDVPLPSIYGPSADEGVSI